jgi:hypothetical protein
VCKLRRSRRSHSPRSCSRGSRRFLLNGLYRCQSIRFQATSRTRSYWRVCFCLCPFSTAASTNAGDGTPPSARWLPAGCPGRRCFISSPWRSSSAADSPCSSLLLLLFLIPVTVMYHPFWKRSGAELVAEADHFLSNLAIVGGLLVIVALGSGPISLIDLSLAQLGRYVASAFGVAR